MSDPWEDFGPWDEFPKEQATDESPTPPALSQLTFADDPLSQPDERELKRRELQRAMDFERMQPRPTAWTGFQENLADVIGDVGREGLNFIPASLKAAGVVASDPWGASQEIGRNILDFIAPGAINVPRTPSEVVPEQQPLYQAGKGAEEFLAETFPPPQVPELSRDVAGGFGQVGSMLGAGGAARAMGAGVLGSTLAATTMGATQEFDDAFTRARQRGDSPDEALAKSLGYATVASMLENNLGAGRILRQLMPNAAEAAKRLTALGVSQKIIGNFLAGGAEEGAQRFAQNVIVDETPSIEGVAEEAIPGAIVQGLTGLPGAGIGTRERTSNAIQQKTKGTVSDVQQPEVAQEGAEQVPAAESVETVAETRVIDEVNRIGSQPLDEFIAETTGRGVSVTKAGYDLAKRMDDSDKARMEELEKESRERTSKFLENKDPTSAMRENNRVQFFNEAIRMYEGLKDVREGKSIEQAASDRGLLVDELRQIVEPKGGEQVLEEKEIQEEKPVLTEPETVKTEADIDIKLPDSEFKFSDKSSPARGLAQMSPAEAIDYVNQTQGPDTSPMNALRWHWRIIMQAFRDKASINAKAAESYEPDIEGSTQRLSDWLKDRGYVKEGDDYVYKPKTEQKATEESQEPVGMGGAVASEFDPPVPFTTSNKNRIVDEERKKRGLPPMMNTARQSNQAAWDEAMRTIDQNPQAQDELINELTENPRALTPTENAMLLHRRIDLRNEYEKALFRWKDAFEFNDLLRASEESQRVKEWSLKLADLEDITKRTGAASGRSLQARKMIANEDFSLAAMEIAAMEAKGRELTSEEHVELIRAQQRILELENRLIDLEGRRESKEVEGSTTSTMKDVEKEAPKESKSKDFDIDREEKLLSGIKAKVDKGQVNDITSLVQQLARVFWRRGVRGREPMIDALHDTLKLIIPTFTRDDTKRAFSGYGNFTPLSKEEIDVGLRDLRGQTQQVLKMEALEARKPLEKTGQERHVPTDEHRHLIKQVNELKRKYGVVVTDPETQLKSALAARKTYYEHRIADLQHEIRTRERIVKTKTTSPTDPELDALIAEVERLKQEHAQIFTNPGLTDEQRLKAALAAARRNQAHWEVRLENAEKGIFDKRTPGRKVTSAELELIQAETAAVREHVQELHDMDAAVIESKRTASLERQKANLEKQIAEQERKLSEGDLSSPGTRMSRPADPELEELIQKRDALNQQLADARKEARKKPEAKKEAEARERELTRLNKLIDEKLAKVAAGDIGAKPKKAERPAPSPELEQARQQLEAVNKQLADLRKQAKPKKTPEEIALQSLKTRMKTEIANLKLRIANKDFSKKERKPVKLDPEGVKLKAELDLAKEEFNAKLEKDRWARMSVFQKTKRKIADVYDAARALMTTGELSFILRQGKLAVLSHPIQTAKALPDMFRALLASEQRTREIDQKTHQDPLADEARAAKLHLVEEGVSLHKQEEILMGRWVGRIPVVQNFNRAAQVFLNRIRMDMWKAMRKSLSKSGTPTPEEDRQIAMFVNEATGRGGLGKAEPAAVPLARVMFSPRYYASRLQLAAGHSLWGGTMRTRRVIATEYARALVGLGLYYTALSMYFAGGDDDEERGEIESDPRSSQFGKVKIGNTRLDPLAGLGQVATLAARTATREKTTLSGKVVTIGGKEVPYGGQKWSDIVADHLRGKLHPVPATVANLFDGTDLGGDEATVINQTQNLVAPITYMDIYAALKEQGLDDGAALALLALLGEGLQTYENR